MRTRLLKPGLFANELLAELPAEGRLLFVGLSLLADREGRLEDRPRRIKVAVFPFDDYVAVDDLLAGLAERGFIARYQAETVAVIQITKFLEHQNPHKNEPASRLPAQFTERNLRLATCRDNNGTTRAVTNTVSDPVRDPKNVSSSLAEPASEPPVLVFPCVGSLRWWPLTCSQVDTWQERYPNLDVLAECRKALSWLEAKQRLKTAAGMARFLVGWLNRAVDTAPPLALAVRPTCEYACPHDPACGTTAQWPEATQFRCHQRTQLEAARLDRAR